DERRERFADTRAAGPVGHGALEVLEDALQAAGAQPGRDARELRREREDLGVPGHPGQAAREGEQEAGVHAHRARGVAEEHDARPLDLAIASRQIDELAGGAEGAPEAAAEIDVAARRRRQATAGARGQLLGEASDGGLEQRQIALVAAIEGLAPEERLAARA